MARIAEVGLVYQPHYKTNCFRVDASACQDDVNYIICCDDRSSYYGVWRWTKSDVGELQPWLNGKRLCFCVPVDKCKQIQTTLTKDIWIKAAQEVCKSVRKKDK